MSIFKTEMKLFLCLVLVLLSLSSIEVFASTLIFRCIPMPNIPKDRSEDATLRISKQTISKPTYFSFGRRVLTRWREDKQGYYGEGGLVEIQDTILDRGGQKGSFVSFVVTEAFAGGKSYHFDYSTEIMTTTQVAFTYLTDKNDDPDLSTAKAEIFIEQFRCQKTR